MKHITTYVIAIMASATPVLASGDGESAGISLLMLLFLGFGALIIVCQLIPSLMLFCSMIKGLFHHAEYPSAPESGAKTL